MSTGVFVEDGVETMEHLVQQRIIERASVEPEALPTENSQLLGYSKRTFPKRMYLLLAVVVMFTISAISTVPAGMDITYSFICYFLGIERGQCLRSDEAGAHVANFTAVGSVIRGGLSLIVTTYMSALSDRQGRRPLIITAMVLTGFAHLCSWYIVFHLNNPSTYWWLMVPTVIDGLGGGAQLVALMCVAYISDMIPDPSQRARLIAIVDGCFFGSIAIGPTLGSFVIRWVGIEVLYIGTFLGAVIAAGLSCLFLQESLSTYHQRRNSTTKRSMRSRMDLLTFEAVEDPACRRNARILLVCALCGTEFVQTFLPVLLLYPKRIFGWTAVESGYLVSAMSTTRTFWFLVGFPLAYARLAKIWTVHKDRVDKIDLLLMRIGILFTIVGYFSMGWSQTPLHYSISGIVDASSSIGLPIYKSAMIKHVPQGQFGTFMAGFNFLCSFVGVFGPTIFLKLYSWAFTWRAYLPFEVIGTLFVVLFLTTYLLKPTN